MQSARLLEEIPVRLVESCIQTRLQANQDTSDLENSLNELGQLSAIRVRPHPTKAGRYQLIFGSRRLQAAIKLGWQTIRADVVQANDQDSLVMALLENLDRKDLSDYEKALFLESIKTSSDKSVEDIAQLIHRSHSFVSLHLAMLDLFPQGIASDEERTKVLVALSERHARILQKIEDPLERWNTAKFVVGARLSVRELERICQSSRKNKDSSEKSLPSPPTPAQSIQDIIWRNIQGISSRNVSLILADASPKSFSLFSRFPPFQKLNAEQAKDHLFNVLRRVNGMKSKVRDIDVQVFGTFACVTMQVRHELQVHGRTTQTETRATLVLAKEENWKIVHEHWSCSDPNGSMDPLGLIESEMLLTSMRKKSRSA